MIALCQFHHWPHNLGEPLQKTMVIVSHPHESSHLCDSCRNWPASDLADVAWIRTNPIAGHHMTQEGHLLFEQVALGWFQLEASSLDVDQDLGQQALMFTEAMAKHYHIVQVY